MEADWGEMAYTLDDYRRDVRRDGLVACWDGIISRIASDGFGEGILSLDGLGELYEIGLAETDKSSKRELGKYYTPTDVARLMSRWLLPLPGSDVADVACGTGRLILAYLSLLGDDEARRLVTSGRVHLYESDPLAARVCAALISVRYGTDPACLDVNVGDFLDASVTLPPSCKAISNPPYARVPSVPGTWDASPVHAQSRELYASFMDKICSQSESSVVITPYSFIGGARFSSLRERICDGRGGIVASFDNIPGSIFSGRKHGVFNTNRANSVRAAITVSSRGRSGYRLTPLIRFGRGERDRLLDTDVIGGMLGNRVQLSSGGPFRKVGPDLEPLFDDWVSASTGTLSGIMSDPGVTLCVPSSCRYFTAAAHRDLARTGKHSLSFDPAYADYAYCMLNSGLCYLWWRAYDGGVGYPLGLLRSMPVFPGLLTPGQASRLSAIAEEMRGAEEGCLSYKANAGARQETVRFPAAYRRRIDAVLLECLHHTEAADALERLHDNHAF